MNGHIVFINIWSLDSFFMQCACKTAVSEPSRRAKEKRKNIDNRIISWSETQLAIGVEKNKSQSKLQYSL